MIANSDKYSTNRYCIKWVFDAAVWEWLYLGWKLLFPPNNFKELSLERLEWLSFCYYMEALSSYSVKLSDFKNDSEAKEKFGKQHAIQGTAASAGSGSQKISFEKNPFRDYSS